MCVCVRERESARLCVCTAVHATRTKACACVPCSHALIGIQRASRSEINHSSLNNTPLTPQHSLRFHCLQRYCSDRCDTFLQRASESEVIKARVLFLKQRPKSPPPSLPPFSHPHPIPPPPLPLPGGGRGTLFPCRKSCQPPGGRSQVLKGACVGTFLNTLNLFLKPLLHRF